MDAARWREISDLAALAADTGRENRAALLAAHPELRAEVESLLRHLEGDGPLDSDPGLFLPVPGFPRSLGPYEVIRELGQGGMGVVLLARRTGVDFEQQVAVKLARLAFRTDFFARRFLEERQILARLDHPNIARLLDGGLTADGTPYLVMQYVEGEPLDRWCTGRGLCVTERLRLVLKVCAAVQYAHENLVVHRDLKPSNILVTPAGEPMLLDFGTARLVEAADAAGGARTEWPVLTLRYASPEQASGMAGSTRSDVYSLCVMLYELLTGGWPYAAEGRSVPELLRAVLEQDPEPPSRRGLAAAGDLDAILLKGLSRDPARRYGTVAQLAEDLRRYLAREPVLARPATWRYRAGRFLARHRAATAAAALLAAGLIAATAVSLRQVRIAERERDTAQEVALFVERLLGASREGGVTPLATRGRDLKVVEILDGAAAAVAEEFQGRPGVEAGLRSTIGSTYMALGDFARARPHVDRAVDLNLRLYGPEHPAAARALTARGRLHMGAGDYAGAQADLARSLAVGARERSENLGFLHSLLGETELRLGRPAAARTHFEAALADLRARFGTRHVATATMINNLGVVAEDVGDATAAERYFQEAADVLRALPGPPPNLFYPLIGLQRCHFFRGDFRRAREICEEAYRVAAAQGEPRKMASALNVLALVQAHQGEPGALGCARRAATLQREAYPPGHFEIGRGLTYLGRVLLQTGQPVAAEASLREAYQVLRKVYPSDNWRTAETRLFLGLAQAVRPERQQEGRAEALAGLREMERVLPAAHPRVAEARELCRNFR